MSTAQQVWLQKLGGANISASTLAEDIIKNDEFQIPKPVAELGSTKKEAREGEKLKSQGLPPGERLIFVNTCLYLLCILWVILAVLICLYWVSKFLILFLVSDNLLLYSRFKQIKEQEARRRQEEEEKRKAEEAAAKGTQPTNEGHEREAKLLERENGAGADSVAESNEEVQSVATLHSSSNVGVVVNGDLSGQDSEEDQKMTPMFRMENDKVSTNSKVDWSDGQQSYEKVEKVW